MLKANGRTYSISDFIDFAQVQGFLRDKVRYKLEDLMKCGCDSEPLGEMLRQFELNETNTFRLFIKPFMDASSWDEDRIDRCCTHVIRPDGKLDSFCRYYSGFADVRMPPDAEMHQGGALSRSPVSARIERAVWKPPGLAAADPPGGIS